MKKFAFILAILSAIVLSAGAQERYVKGQDGTIYINKDTHNPFEEMSLSDCMSPKWNKQWTLHEKLSMNFSKDKVVKTTYNFNTYADVIAALPALPTAEQMASPAMMEDFREVLANFENGVEILHQKMLAATGDMKFGNATLKLPQEEIDKIAELSLQGHEAVMAYMKEHHKKAYKEMQKYEAARKTNKKKTAQYEALGEKLQQLVDRDTTAFDYRKFDQPFLKLREDLINDWSRSEEAKSIDRLDKSDAKGINMRICVWNVKAAEKWRNQILASMQTEGVEVQKIVALDTELEQLRGKDKATDSVYLAQKKKSALLGGVIKRYVEILNLALTAPLIEIYWYKK